MFPAVGPERSDVSQRQNAAPVSRQADAVQVLYELK